MKLEGADVQGSSRLQIKQVRSSVAKAQNKKCLLVKIKFIDKPKTLSLEDKEKPFVLYQSYAARKVQLAPGWGLCLLHVRVLGGEGRSVVDSTS